MPNPMNEEEMKYFIGAAQMGMACGLSHPWEWLANALRVDWMPFDQRPSFEDKTVNAFVKFWNGCGSHPNDPCETAETNELLGEINRWYAETKDDEHEARG
jgi:hypothetical protein